MLAMSVLIPVLVMCLIGVVVELLLRWHGRGHATTFALAIVGVWFICGLLWSGLACAFLAVFAPAEAIIRWPDDLPNLLRAIAFSGLVALVPALIIIAIRSQRRPTHLS